MFIATRALRSTTRAQDASGDQNGPGGGGQPNPGIGADGTLNLAACTEPTRELYRPTPTELNNAIGSVLKLSEAERLDLKSALPVDPSKTGYENDLNAMHVTPELIFALSASLDRVLTAEKVAEDEMRGLATESGKGI